MQKGGGMEERILIAIGGLLHDIGKLKYRAEKEIHKYTKIEDKDHFLYAHAGLSYQVINEVLDNLKIYDEKKRKFVVSSSFHHKPVTDHPEASDELFYIRAIFRLADWYASVERSKELDTEKKESFKRLKPIFEKINITNQHSKEEYIYKIAPISIKCKENEYPPIFPISKNQAKDYVKGNKEELYEHFYGSYKEAYNGFINAFKIDKSFNSLEHKLSYVYHVMYKYTWCIPASIYDRENYHSHYPDISLFDHSRVVAALATSLYTNENINILKHFKDQERTEYANKLRIVIFEGDISGIQRFIYDISNVKGVAKRLRGRSIFLSFLPELIGRSILKKLGYPWTNLLYAGGGKFQAVIGYENGIINKLNGISTHIDKSLAESFGGKLGFVIYSKEICISQLEDYPTVVKNLLNIGNETKKKKFLSVLINSDDILNKEIDGSVKLCPSCRWEFVKEEMENCSLCESFKELGDYAVKSKYLIFSPKLLKDIDTKGVYINNIGGIYLAKDIKDYREFGDLFILNRPEELEKGRLITGFRFMANVVPETEDSIKSFEEIAEEIKEGDKKLAFVLADVDNLGFIFMKGLGTKYTISRVATLSRSLDLFFSGYLNMLFQTKEFKGKIYTLYAGGDDLFIIAPWDTAFRVMINIRECFGDYVCHNPAFGLSCGIFLTGSNYPVRLAYEGVKNAEDKAKTNIGKDSICALGEVLKWNELYEVSTDAEYAIRSIASKELSRTNLYKIYLLLREYKAYDQLGDDKKYMFYPFFYYFLSRNIPKEHQEYFVNLFIDVKNNYKVKNSAIFAAKYILMKTRNIRC